MEFPSATSMYLSVYTSEPITISEISGDILQVSPESKIQFISCELSPKYLLGISTLEDICAIDAYILCDLFCSIILSDYLFIFVNFYAQFLTLRKSSETLPWIFQLQTIWNPVMLLSTSEARILILIVKFSTFIFSVAWIERWIGFIFALSFSILPKTLFSLVWSSTITAPWVRKVCYFCSSYWNIKIQIINL